jgi:hypothetical protein
VISDFRVIGDQEDLFGLVASVPTAWRTLDEIARGGQRALGKITAAVNTARRRAWAAAAARHGAIPAIQVADKTLDGVTCLRLDASVVTCHSDKEGAEANFKGFGLLTELPDVAAAQVGCPFQQSIAEMSGRSRLPSCCSFVASPIATETGHARRNQSLVFSLLPIFDVSHGSLACFCRACDLLRHANLATRLAFV